MGSIAVSIELREQRSERTKVGEHHSDQHRRPHVVQGPQAKRCREGVEAPPHEAATRHEEEEGLQAHLKDRVGGLAETELKVHVGKPQG